MNKLARDRFILIFWTMAWLLSIYVKVVENHDILFWIVLTVGILLTLKEIISPTDYNQ